jgi:hypothetical protein
MIPSRWTWSWYGRSRSANSWSSWLICFSMSRNSSRANWCKDPASSESVNDARCPALLRLALFWARPSPCSPASCYASAAGCEAQTAARLRQEESALNSRQVHPFFFMFFPLPIPYDSLRPDFFGRTAAAQRRQLLRKTAIGLAPEARLAGMYPETAATSSNASAIPR